MKTVLFVPGYLSDPVEPGNQVVWKSIESQGYRVVPVSIDWSKTTPDDWLREFMVVYDQYDQTNTILGGFSYGAIVALMAAAERPPTELWLCSLSPYFNEDIPYLKHLYMRTLGSEKAEPFWRLPFKPFIASVTCPTKVFAGSGEPWPRPSLAGQLLTNASVIIVKNVGHDFWNPAYIDAIRSNI